MDDPLLVSMLNCLAHRHEQMQPGIDGQSLSVAIFGERHPFDQFHDEVRLAGRGNTAVEDAGDVRVVHQGQRLPLGVEPGEHPFGVHPCLDQLQGHLPLHRLRLTGQVHRAHAPFADHFDQRVATGDNRADPISSS